MKTYWTEGKLAKKYARAAFPDCKKRAVAISPLPPSAEIELRGNYWDGGSRSYWAAVKLDSKTAVTLGAQNPLIDPRGPKTAVPPGYLVAERVYFCGKDMGVTLHVRPENFALLLSSGEEEVSWAEKVVLSATRGLKNTYGGQTDLRFKEAYRIVGISREEWNEAKGALTERGLLRKNGSITTEGRNAIGWADLYSLRREK